MFLVLLLISFCSMVSAGLNDKISMDFRDADVRDICKLIAGRGGMGIAIAKSVRGNMTISLKDVTLREALDLVTQASGFAWAQTRGTILITDELRLGRELKVINLKHLDAGEAAKILTSSIAGDFKLATCQESNSLVINGSRGAVNEAMQIVGHVDKPGKYVKASLRFTCGDQVLQKYDFSAKIGDSLRFSEQFNFKPARDGQNKNISLLSLECKLNLSGISKDGLIDASISLKARKAGKVAENESVIEYGGRFQAEKGRATEVLSTSQGDPVKVLFTWEK